MNIKLENLQPGKWRYLTTPEIDKMNELVRTSSKIEEAPAPKKEFKKKQEQLSTKPAKPKEKEKLSQQKTTAAKSDSKEAGAKPAKKSTSYKEWRNKRNY